MKRLVTTTLFALLALLAGPAVAQQPPGGAAQVEDGDEVDRLLNELLDFIGDDEPDFDRIIGFLERNFEDPESLDAVYQNLPDHLKQKVESQVELWSFEGGLGLAGGVSNDEGGTSGLFRLSVSGGIVWPFGDFSLPIYYVFTDIPGPWALGFSGHLQTDNFGTAAAGLSLRWAYEYLGTTPYVEVGPAAQLDIETSALSPGIRAELGYGNILLQGFVQSDVYFDSAVATTVVAGVRIPFILLTLL